jgi:hypothetical protein
VTRQPRPLPGDAYLAELLGWSEDQLLHYQIERQQAAAREYERNPPVATCGPAALGVISLVTTILSVGYTVLSSLLAPRPRRPGQVTSSQQQGSSFLIPGVRCYVESCKTQIRDRDMHAASLRKKETSYW